MIFPKIRFIFMILASMCIILLGGLMTLPLSAQDNPQYDACSDVRMLMDNDATPSDLNIGGGVINPNSSVTGMFSEGYYGDIWVFSYNELLNENGAIVPVTITLDLTTSLDLEYAIFNGLRPLAGGYQTTSDIIQRLTMESVYTVVVRRRHISNPEEGEYQLALNISPSLTGAIIPPILPQVEDREIREKLSDAEQLTGGLVDFTISQSESLARVRSHAAGITLVSSRADDLTQIYFQNDRNDFLITGRWAQQFDLIGGDFVVRGDNRLLYIQDFDYNIQEPNDPNLRTLPGLTNINWDVISGVWVFEECLGFKFNDNRTMIIPIRPENRSIVLEGPKESFAIQVSSPDENGNLVRYNGIIDFTDVAPNSESTWIEGSLKLPLRNDREFELQAINITLLFVPDEDSIQNLNLNVSAGNTLERNITINLDWVNMRAFSLSRNQINIEFTDVPRGATTRDGSGLIRFEAIDDVIEIVYADRGDIPGERRLMLPRSESYLEIVTPAEPVSFNGFALPDEPGYAPRGMNNMGGDCYLADTVIPIVDCAPNGHFNPANGNLWLNYIDQFASGDLLDLSLSRSYNSRDSVVNGPFGWGWTTMYRLDYNVAFDPEMSARVITSDQYPTSLDIRYAPFGVITYQTPSGSKHQFVTPTSRPGADDLYQSLTMPDWQLRRASIRNIWSLTKNNGEVLEFDRAGRLLRFGYPTRNQMIQINYDFEFLDGPQNLGQNTSITIHEDVANPPRQLELYYDDDGHIYRSYLRDMTVDGAQTGATCSPDMTCFTTEYRYDGEGYLHGVTYANGESAQYDYQQTRLIFHDDPAAPVASKMSYQYISDGTGRKSEIIDEVDVPHPYQELEILFSNDVQHQVEIIDHRGNSTTYTLNLGIGQLRTEEGINGIVPYELFSISKPLPADEEQRIYNQNPQIFVWENGRVTRIEHNIGGIVGRKTIDFRYHPDTGYIACIACDLDGVPELEIKYITIELDGIRQILPSEIRYDDGTIETFNYNARGFLQQHIDRYGAIYQYTWDGLQIASITRNQDSVIWSFSYNAIGLITQTRQVSDGNTEEVPYIIDYEYDGLGRVTRITDNVTGIYELRYDFTTLDGTDEIVSVIESRDPINTVERHYYTLDGRLVRVEIRNGDKLLSDVYYRYDAYRNLIAQAVAISETEDVATEFATTTYEYTTADESEWGENVDYSITIIDPTGQREVFTFDPADRLRSFSDVYNRIDYAYTVRNLSLSNGLRITETRQDLRNSDASQVTRYDFDFQRQLRYVNTDQAQWELLLRDNIGLPTTLDASVNGNATIQELRWNSYQNGLPSSMNIVLPLIDSNRRFARNINVQNDQRPGMEANYDFIGRPIYLETGSTVPENTSSNLTYPISYCDTGGSVYSVIYHWNNSIGTSCETPDFQQVLTFDAHNRLIEVVDDSGVRHFSYTAQPEAGRWLINATFEGGDNSEPQTWQLAFNGVSDIVEWIDEHGTQENYQYDLRGYLVQIISNNDLENGNSYTFTYDTVGHLIRIESGVGKGFVYNYDLAGNVIGAIQTDTLASTSYVYDSNSNVSSLVLPSGDTWLFEYLDEDFDRVTGVVDPRGNRQEFIWDDVNGILTYVNPVDLATHYYFDILERLWRVVEEDRDEEEQRITEITYDDTGFVNSFYLDVAEGEADRHYAITHSPREMTIRADGWQQTLSFTGDGNLRSAGSLSFIYDPLAQLVEANIPAKDTNNAMQWLLNWQDQTGHVTLEDNFGHFRVYEFDELNRQIYQEERDEPQNFIYESVPTLRNPTLSTELTITRPFATDIVYTFMPGNAFDDRFEPPSIRVEVGDREAIYHYTTNNLLTQVEIIICPDEREDCPQQHYIMTLEYDANDNPSRVIHSDGRQERYSYDNLGQLISYENADGYMFLYDYDEFNRLSRIVTLSDFQLLIQYNAHDEVTGICRNRVSDTTNFDTCIVENDLVEFYSYNGRGQLIERQYPIFGSQSPAIESYTYETTGHLQSMETPGSSVVLAYNSLDQVVAVEVDGGLNTITYDDLDRVTATSDQSYAFDTLNRLILSNTEGFLQHFSYAEGRVAIDVDGLEWQIEKDSRGYLSQIGIQDSLLQVEYQHDPQGIVFKQENEIMNAIIYEFVGDQIENIFYDSSAGSVLVSPQFSPEGRLLNLTLQDLISDQLRDYEIINSYNSDRQPATTRIILRDRDAPRVISLQTYSYDNQNRRIEETQRFEDGTQLVIEYSYDDASGRLQNQTIRYGNSLLHLNGFTSFFVSGLVLLLILRLPRYRRYIILVVLVTMTSIVFGQTDRSVFEFQYNYNSLGLPVSITEIGNNVTCATFSYDTQGRLTEYAPVDMQNLRQYRYDLYGQLRSINDIQLVYRTDNNLASLIGPTETTFFNQPENYLPHLVQSSTGKSTWLYHDSSTQYVKTATSDGVFSDTLLTDPFGRAISLGIPVISEPTDVCRIGKATLPENDLPPILTVGGNRLWDTSTGVYFDGSRAMDPRTGLYLQRSLTPNVADTVYDTYPSTTIPAQTDSQPRYIDGLLLLEQVTGSIHPNPALQADNIKVNAIQLVNRNQNELYMMGEAYHQPFSDRVTTLMQLPHWLQTEYNIQAPEIDWQTGLINMPDSDMPGQSRRSSWEPTFDLSYMRWEDALLQSIQPGMQDIMTVMEQGQPVRHNFMSMSDPTSIPIEYTIYQWDALPTHAMMTSNQLPDAVLDWLPSPLSAPEASVNIMSLLSEIQQLPQKPVYNWLDTTLRESLPAEAELPPVSLDIWLARWFEYNPAQVYSPLNSLLPALPEQQIFPVGFSEERIYSD